MIEKRKNESEEARKKREEKEEKDREQDRQFVREVADAYNFHFVGIESLGGREAYVIDGEPRPGYQGHFERSKIPAQVPLPRLDRQRRIAVEEARHPVHRYGFLGPVSGARPQRIAHHYRAN